jgi:hypothetical protein
MGGEEMPWRRMWTWVFILLIALAVYLKMLSIGWAVLLVVVSTVAINFAGVSISAWRRWPK